MGGRVSTSTKTPARKTPTSRKSPAIRPAETKTAAKPMPAGAGKQLRAIFARPLDAKPVAPAATSPKAKHDASPNAGKKPKLVRDSFTMPKSEYALLEQTKKRAQGLGRQVKKSELLRAGLAAIAALGDAAFVAAIDLVPRIKTGQPKRGSDPG